MNVHEGSRRIQRIGKAALVFSGIVLLLGVLAIVIFHSVANNPALQFVPMALLLALYPAFFGGLLWMAGWIIEGFASRPTGIDSSGDPHSRNCSPPLPDHPNSVHHPDRI